MPIDKRSLRVSLPYGAGVREANLADALYNIDTKFPSGYDEVAAGARFVTKAEAAHATAADQTTVFISYAWGDKDVVRAIDQWLRIKGIGTRIDEQDFFAGESIRNEIYRVMRDCNVVLVFYFEASRERPWTEFERQLAGDLEINAKQQGQTPPRIIYIVLGDATPPDGPDKFKLAVMTKGKRFPLVCEEIYHQILRIPKESKTVDLNAWNDYVF
jgi:hypothetical protein